MLFNKLKWVVGVMMVFFLVLATNLIDQRNFQVLQDSIKAIYEKQLVSKNIILNLSSLVHEKQLANALSDSGFYAVRNQEVTRTIDQLLEEFEAGELAYLERRILTQCKERLQKINSWEAARVKDPESYFAENRNQDLAQELEKVREDLMRLSSIQLEEGRVQMMSGQNAISSINMFSRWENIFLIVMAILVQILILYSPKRSKSKG